MVKQSLSHGKRFRWIKAKWLISAWVTVSIGCSIFPANAQVYRRGNRVKQATEFQDDSIQFIPPPPSGSGRGGTGQRVDMGRRGPCLTLLSPESGYLTALIPKSEIDFTVSEKPTVWVYVPDTTEDISRMVLTLKNRQTWQINRFDLEVRSLSPGVLHISWPDTMAPLAVGDTYDWAVTIFDGCESANGPSERYIEGRIQRQASSPALEQQLAQALTQRDQAAVYAHHGIWYDALSHLGDAYRTDPQNSKLALDWQSLLTALELDLSDRGIPVDTFGSEFIGNQPLIECCQEPSDLADSEF